MKRLTPHDINTPEHFDQVWSLENAHRFDEVRMRAFTDYLPHRGAVLDVGAGLYGWAEFALSKWANGRTPTLEFHAIDFSPKAKAIAAERCPRLNYHLGNVLEMPAEWDSKFALVGAGELIEHMEDPQALVNEMARVMRNDGGLIIGTVDPECEDSIRNRVEYPEHLWQFTKDDLCEMVSKVCRYAAYARVGNYDFVYGRVKLGAAAFGCKPAENA
jgi:ubiquinone/menaquinone biosynthesis C-methylase UbiE